MKKKKKLDYETLLDDWAEQLLNEVGKYDKLIENSNENNFKHGLHIGMRDGIMKALVNLHMLEHRKNKKYIIND